MSARLRLLTLLFAIPLGSGCFQGDTDPCSELCDGIARCRMSNERCIAEGMTARDPFMEQCTMQCSASADPIRTADELLEAHECLDCLRAEADFAACNGELLVDGTCSEECRTPSATTFRDSFGPALWTELSCLSE